MEQSYSDTATDDTGKFQFLRVARTFTFEWPPLFCQNVKSRVPVPSPEPLAPAPNMVVQFVAEDSGEPVAPVCRRLYRELD